MADDGPLANLYAGLSDVRKISYVSVSKLLAAKRPALVPIRDRVIETLLGAGERWWAPMR
jgi:hypothetical protein